MGKKKTGRHNILYFSSFGSMKGGGQRSLFYLVRGLNKNIFNPIVVCPEEGELVNKLKETGIETLVMPFKRLRQMSAGFVLRLLRLFKDRDISIVHTDSTTETFYAGIAARLLGVPLIWHIRVSSGSIMDRLLSLLSTRLILVAKALESRFPYLHANKLTPIINGISVEEFDAFPGTDIKKETGTDKDSVIIGCIGRIEAMKGQEYLVRAIERVEKERRDFRIMLIGEADETYYKNIVDLMESLKVKIYFSYLGYRTDTAGIIKGLDILVSASSFGEGLSRVILEAMAAGKPVIATDIGGSREAIIDGLNGCIIPARDYNALADAILKLLNSPEKRKEMGTQGRRRVEQRFSLTNNIKRTEQLYLEILKNAD